MFRVLSLLSNDFGFWVALEIGEDELRSARTFGFLGKSKGKVLRLGKLARPKATVQFIIVCLHQQLQRTSI